MMLTVACPSCGEKGKVPDGFVGTRLKCRKCGGGFQVTGPPAPAPTPMAAKPVAAPAPAPVAGAAAPQPRGDEIVVDGLDDGAWATATASVGPGPRADSSVAVTQDFQPIREPEPGTIKHYKILTPRDRYFEGKFDLAKLEEALNHFARDGWVVRGMATPHIASFQGEKEELVILLER